MVLITATFITEGGWATGLSPKIDILKQDGTEIIADAVMSEIGNGNYSYEFSEYDKDNLYYYNIDADDDDVVNRYHTANNELDYYNNKDDWRGPGIIQGRGTVSIKDEEKKKKKLIMEAVKEVLKDFKPVKEINIDEIIVPIVKKIDESIVEVDYDIIDHSISKINQSVNKSEEKIIKNIKDRIGKISIPKYDEDKIIKEIKNIDLSKVVDILTPIDTLAKTLESKLDIILKNMEHEIDAKEILTKAQLEVQDFKQSISDFRKVVKTNKELIDGLVDESEIEELLTKL